MPESAFKTGSVILLDVLKSQTALVFEDPFEVVTCSDLGGVPACLQRLEAAQAEGVFAAGFLAYELGYAFEEKLKTRFRASGEPLLWFGLYKRQQSLPATDVLDRLAEAGHKTSGVTDLAFDMSSAGYEKAFDQVQHHLGKGDAYQVNLTMRAGFRHEETPEQLFLKLLRQQPVEHAAFLKLDDRSVLSLSPELFLERQGDLLRTKPMKGTAARGRFASEDNRLALELERDPKQRSENTMIVDLMRNDLSHVAETGTVKVTRLCEVERYKSLHQMTSTIEGKVTRGTGFGTIIRRLFPCGSITGAPKLSAMQIAHELETGPRGVYTGSIGHLAPGGDFRLNVAIRTLVLKGGTGIAGAGSGVIVDSSASQEYDECALKLRFMTQDLPDFDLIETMAFDPQDGFLLLERHLQRLQKSSDYFGFKFSREKILSRLDELAATYRSAQRVRLLLNSAGEISVSSTELTPVDQATVFNLVLARETTSPGDPFLFHKTTHRSFYDTTRIRYQAETGCQEVLFANEEGFLTEGSYMSLFIKRDGRLLTPSLRHGLLPGTFRAGLLETGLALEADLKASDIETADEVFVGNSVRGLVKGRLLSAELSASMSGEKEQAEHLPGRKAG